MERNDFSRLLGRLRALAVFRTQLCDHALESLLDFLESRAAGNPEEAASSYGEFVADLYEASAGDLAAHVRDAVFRDENPYIRAVGRGETPPEFMRRCVEEELRTLQAVADLTPDDLLEGMDGREYLPGFTGGGIGLAESYFQRLAEIGRYGCGIYTEHHMFYLETNGRLWNAHGGVVNAGTRIVPVRHPDPIRLSGLADYQRERQLILDNTKALLAGRPAANTLLTGDAGTGKSSTIKAVVNELYQEGLRIIEVRKDQLRALPDLLDQLSENPLKFILFIDDLSFQKGDDNYSALKAVLEGSVSAKSRNVVIYATSNRRHLVKETFSGREGDDIHRSDTMQELISLSDRFGLQVTFQKPDKAAYLRIVRHLADDAGVTMERSRLEELAERFALGRGGRSCRAARQFVEGLVAAEAPGY